LSTSGDTYTTTEIDTFLSGKVDVSTFNTHTHTQDEISDIFRGIRNTTLGEQAGASIDTLNTGSNTLIGYQAGNSITTAQATTLIGRDSGLGITTRSGNTGVGEESLRFFDNSARSATAIGQRAGQLSGGDYTTFIGTDATGNGIRGIALGYNAEFQGIDTIQIGQGTNSNEGTLQIWDHKLLDKTTGLIPAERIPSTEIVEYAASKTLELTDAGKMLKVTGEATITIPADATLNFPVGTEVVIAKYGEDDVTIEPGSGVTLNGAGVTTLTVEYTAATIKKIAADEWLLVGPGEESAGGGSSEITYLTTTFDNNYYTVGTSAVTLNNLTLPAGTWMIMWNIPFERNSGDPELKVELWEGSTFLYNSNATADGSVQTHDTASGQYIYTNASETTISNKVWTPSSGIRLNTRHEDSTGTLQAEGKMKPSLTAIKLA
jgi:hypothetical protein